MFDGVARRYDFTNSVFTAGQDRRWRRLTREALTLRPGEKVLDLAAGTAVSTVGLLQSGAWCVAADFSLGMLNAGAGRSAPRWQPMPCTCRSSTDASTRSPSHSACATSQTPTALCTNSRASRAAAGDSWCVTRATRVDPVPGGSAQRIEVRAAGDREADLQQLRGLLLPRGVCSRLVFAGRVGPPHRRCWLGRCRLAQSCVRCSCTASCPSPLASAATAPPSWLACAPGWWLRRRGSSASGRRAVHRDDEIGLVRTDEPGARGEARHCNSAVAGPYDCVWWARAQRTAGHGRPERRGVRHDVRRGDLGRTFRSMDAGPPGRAGCSSCTGYRLDPWAGFARHPAGGQFPDLVAVGGRNLRVRGARRRRAAADRP